MFNGLKIENDAVFIKKEPNDTWKRATYTNIHELEDLLRKIDTFKYSREDIKEEIIFENEIKVGQSTIKSFKDEDGDLVYTVKKDDRKIQAIIDEDFGFEQSNVENLEVEKYEIKNESELNLWSPKVTTNSLASKRKIDNDLKPEKIKVPKVEDKKINKVGNELIEKHVKESNKEAVTRAPTIEECIKNLKLQQNTSFRIVGKASEEELNKIQEKIKRQPPIITHAKKIQCVTKAPDYTFRKRGRNEFITKENRALQVLLREFKRLEAEGYSEEYSTSAHDKISFMKKSVSKNVNKISGCLLKAKSRYSNSLLKPKSEVHALFKLEKIVLKNTNDDVEFDEILNKTIHTEL